MNFNAPIRAQSLSKFSLKQRKKLALKHEIVEASSFFTPFPVNINIAHKMDSEKSLKIERHTSSRKNTTRPILHDINTSSSPPLHGKKAPIFLN